MVSRDWSSRLALRPASNFLLLQFHNVEASRLALRPSLCFKFSLAGTSTTVSSLRKRRCVLVAIRFAPRAGLAEPRLQALPRPRRASKRLDCMLWKYATSCINIIERESAEGRQPSKPTRVSVQDVVLNSLRPSTQPSQPLPELSHFYTHTSNKERCLAHVAMVLVGVSRLDTK